MAREAWPKNYIAKLIILIGIYSVSTPPSVFYAPQLQILCLYSTLPCNKIARALEGRKKYKLTKLGAKTE